MHELVGADLVGRALHDLAAVVHHRDALGDAQGDVHVVLDEDQRDARVELEQQVGERHALAAREARGRLVEEHELRVDGARHPDLELALLAVRDRAHERPELRLQADGRGQLAGALAHLAVDGAAAQAQVPAARAEHGEVEVVLDRQAEEEPGLLVRAPHPEARPAGGRELADVLAQELDRPGGRRHVAGDDVEERRLPGPVGARGWRGARRARRRGRRRTRHRARRTAGRPPAGGGSARRSR